MFSLNGKACLVVGGSGGIGREIALGLAEQGGDVALTYRRRAEVAAGLVDRITALGRRAVALACDVAKPGDQEACVAETHKQLGRIDVAITTVGWHPFARFLEMSEQDIDHMIEAEFRSIMRLTRAVLPIMSAQKGGRLIIVGSDSGKVGNRNAAMSSACRGGVIAFAKAIAREHAVDNILANVVCPGPTDTDLWREEIGSDEAARKIMAAMVRAIPLRRPGTAREVASLAVFLASDEASYITGQAISVSGGLTMN